MRTLPTLRTISLVVVGGLGCSMPLLSQETTIHRVSQVWARTTDPKFSIAYELTLTCDVVGDSSTAITLTPCDPDPTWLWTYSLSSGPFTISDKQQAIRVRDTLIAQPSTAESEIPIAEFNPQLSPRADYTTQVILYDYTTRRIISGDDMIVSWSGSDMRQLLTERHASERVLKTTALVGHVVEVQIRITGNYRRGRLCQTVYMPNRALSLPLNDNLK